MVKGLNQLLLGYCFDKAFGGKEERITGLYLTGDGTGAGEEAGNVLSSLEVGSSVPIDGHVDNGTDGNEEYERLCLCGSNASGKIFHLF